MVKGKNEQKKTAWSDMQLKGKTKMYKSVANT